MRIKTFRPVLQMIGLVFVFFARIGPSEALVQIPGSSAPVVDQAQIFSSGFESKMNRILKEVVQKGGPQIGVLTLKSLEDETIEQTSIRAADQWKLGTKDKDNGVLVLLAQEERKVRIEVGQGLEGDLTDFESSRIIQELMLPLFKQGDFDSGLYLGIARIVQVTAPDLSIDQIFGEQSQFQPRSKSEKKGFSWVSLIIFIFAFFLFIRNPGLFLLLLAGSGRRGGGFGGGGGWSGGGGGFSGGGASGGW